MKMLCGLLSKKKKTGANTCVYLNVYDLMSINTYAYWFGLGAFHSGVEVHGVEYSFGRTEDDDDMYETGVFHMKPKQCPNYTLRKSILIGKTNLGPEEVEKLVEELSDEYMSSTYNLLSLNCNHFCNHLCQRLTGKRIPRWINRVARLGRFLCKATSLATPERRRDNQVVDENMIQPEIKSPPSVTLAQLLQMEVPCPGSQTSGFESSPTSSVATSQLFQADSSCCGSQTNGTDSSAPTVTLLQLLQAEAASYQDSFS